MTHNSHNTAKHRQGVTLLECTVALALLAAGLVMAAEVLVQCARNRQDSEKLLAVQLEAANVAERIAAMPYAELTPTNLQQISLSKSFQAWLPGVQLHISSIDASTGDPPHRRVKIEIVWPGEEETPRTVSLTTWRFPALTETTP